MRVGSPRHGLRANRYLREKKLLRCFERDKEIPPGSHNLDECLQRNLVGEAGLSPRSGTTKGAHPMSALSLNVQVAFVRYF
jgi:hypothetical protein